MKEYQKRTVHFSCRITQEDFDYLCEVSKNADPWGMDKRSAGDMIAFVVISHKDLAQYADRANVVPGTK